MTVKIKKVDDLSIQIVTDNRAYIADIKDFFTDYVEGFRFMPRYKQGGWNGKISMFTSNNTLPFGLLFDVILFHKKLYKDLDLSIDQDVKEFFTGIDVDPDYDLNIFPRPYQLECIETCLKYRSGLVVAATASGKSVTITYIIKTLFNTNNISKALIIVPTINLVTQFHADMIDYGIDEDQIGRVYSKLKEFDKPIVISTWQTLIKNMDKLSDFDCVICDEVHISKAKSVQDILKHCNNTKFRYGFTGTMPLTKLDIWNIKSYLGPILKTFGSSELAEQGYISYCTVNLINIDYNDLEKYKGEYNDVKDMIFTNENRLKYIHKTLQNLDGNVLVLVGKVEKEGKILKDYLDKHNTNGKEIVFIYGDTKIEEREYWRLEMGKRNNIILIATYQLFQLGINAPSLKYMLFASPFKSKIRTLQSIGRTLRKHDSKDQAIIYDLVDMVDYLEDHGMRRRKFYEYEKFTINEINKHENELILNSII